MASGPLDRIDAGASVVRPRTNRPHLGRAGGRTPLAAVLPGPAGAQALVPPWSMPPFPSTQDLCPAFASRERGRVDRRRPASTTWTNAGASSSALPLLVGRHPEGHTKRDTVSRVTQLAGAWTPGTDARQPRRI